MAEESVLLRMREAGARAVQRAAQATGRSIRTMGRNTDQAGRRAGFALRSYTGLGNGLWAVSRGATALGIGLGAAGLAATRWGLQFNSQVETAVNRFGLFTRNQAEANRLFESMQRLNKSSVFGLAEISNAAAYLGNAGMNAGQVQKRMQGIANAAAAAGGGNERLNRITIALGQMANNGIVAREEINQLNEAGARTGFLRKALKLSSKEWRNLGEQGISSNKVINLLMENWTSGKMAKAAENQTKTFSGQLSMLRDQAHEITGQITKPLFDALRRDVLPEANRWARGIGAIWDRDDMDFGKKVEASWNYLSHASEPMAARFTRWLRAANIDDKLRSVIEWSGPQIARGFEVVAPMAVAGFVKGWQASPWWAKLLTGAMLIAKTRPVWSAFGALASAATCGKFKGAFGACLGRSAAPAGAAAFGSTLGLAIGAAAGAKAVYEIGQAVERYTGHEGNRPGKVGPVRTTPSTQGRKGESLAGILANRILGGKPVTDPGRGSGGAIGVRPIAPLPRGRGASVGDNPVIIDFRHTTVLDGKEVAKSTTRHATRKKAVK